MNRFRNAGMMALGFVLLRGAALAQGASPMEILKLPVPATARTLQYGLDPLQTGEMRLPRKKGKVPVVVLVHGGCWVDHLPGAPPAITTNQLLRPLAEALTAVGVATWNVEYRRAGSPGGGWPNTFLDLGNALDFLRRVAQFNHFDLSRVVVVGHSSGGQLGLWLAARGKLPKTSEIFQEAPLAVSQVISIDGPPDLAISQPLEDQFCPVPGITQLLGGTPAEQPVRYKEGSGESYLPLGVAQTFLEGSLLQAIPAVVTDYQKLAGGKGDSVTVTPLQDAGHFGMLDPASASGKIVVQTILKATQKKP